MQVKLLEKTSPTQIVKFRIRNTKTDHTTRLFANDIFRRTGLNRCLNIIIFTQNVQYSQAFSKNQPATIPTMDVYSFLRNACLTDPRQDIKLILPSNMVPILQPLTKSDLPIFRSKKSFNTSKQ